MRLLQNAACAHQKKPAGMSGGFNPSRQKEGDGDSSYFRKRGKLRQSDSVASCCRTVPAPMSDNLPSSAFQQQFPVLRIPLDIAGDELAAGHYLQALPAHIFERAAGQRGTISASLMLRRDFSVGEYKGIALHPVLGNADYAAPIIQFIALAGSVIAYGWGIGCHAGLHG
jgi:hypothetical protein